VNAHAPRQTTRPKIGKGLHHNPEIDEIIQRRYQFRWERVEYEAKKIERGTWHEPKHTLFTPRDDHGNVIPKIDLRTLAQEKKARAREIPVTKLEEIRDIPASYNTGSSLADRVRIVTDEE
jgi:hypothetical protein